MMQAYCKKIFVEVHLGSDGGGRPERERRGERGQEHRAEDHTLHRSCKVKFKEYAADY